MNEEFDAYRGLLFTIAYRMTGSAADAEDLVQDAYVRYASADRDVVRDVKAFLVTILTRLALDKLKSAQHQRETYVGPWLPEPVLTGIDGDPYARATRDEKVQMALLRALERLNPNERAVLLLHEVLEHDHNEIADLLGITAAASRQILHRARERVTEERRRFEPSREEQERLIAGFMSAVQDGDLERLRSVLAADVTGWSDGGGKTYAARRPLVGFDDVARLYLGLGKQRPENFRATIEDVNGAPGIVTWIGDTLLSVMAFGYDGDRISQVLSIVNPDKLQFVRKQLSRA